MSGRRRLWLPLAIFAALAWLVGISLWHPGDRSVHSALIGQPLPSMAMPAMVPGKPAPASGATGHARLVNVFASWCIPCAAEAPQLAKLKALGVQIDGVAVRDTPKDTAAFLTRYGDPYRAIGDDRSGLIEVSLGSSGVPESYVVGADGRILLQQIGPIRDDDIPQIAAAVGAGQ